MSMLCQNMEMDTKLSGPTYRENIKVYNYCNKICAFRLDVCISE